MKASIYQGNKTFGVGDGRIVAPRPGEVRLKVAYCGICGTDLHIYQGHMDGRVGIPQVIGHEMSGEIAELGEGVIGWEVGDQVTLLGFFVYTLSILLGSLWAWRHLSLRLEARSFLAVLTWAVYALMIQGRITAGWQGRKAAQLTVAGTLCAVSVIVVYLARA